MRSVRVVHKPLEFWHERGYRGSFIYVLTVADDYPVKIGFASGGRRGVWNRVRSLQTGNPRKLHLLHVVPADRRLENWLHRYNKPHRLEGEWFDGREITETLERVAEMEQRMVDEHNGTTEPPDFVEYAQWIPYRSRRVGESQAKTNATPIVGTVRFVEPTPLTEEEKMANLRAHYLRPARPIEKRPY